MKAFVSLLIIFYFPLVAFAKETPKIKTFTLINNNIERSFEVTLPKKKGFKKKHIIIYLKDLNLSASENDDDDGTLRNFSYNNNIIFIEAKALRSGWNFARPNNGYKFRFQNTKDISFIKNLIVYVKKRYHLRHTRISVVGYSSGGFMALALACQSPKIIDAIAIISASLTKYSHLKCQLDYPISILSINGDNDPLMPYTGGNYKIANVKYKILSVKKMHRFWLKQNVCESKSKITYTSKEKSANFAYKIFQYGPCWKNSIVTFIRLYGSGHSWPGGHSLVEPLLYGLQNQTLNASKHIITFLRSIP